jgi:hypothetical protein
VRADLEDGNDFKGLNRAAARFAFDTTSRFGVQSNWNWYRERLPCGCTDDTLLTDTNFTVRFAQSPQGYFYTGLGFRLLADQSTARGGFNWVYGLDFFPSRSWITSTSVDLGTLGGSFLVHWRGSVGVTWHGWELFGGYDYLRVNRVELQGPMLGLRVWF